MVIWHEMSERAFGFGSQTINGDLLRLVQFWQYSALQCHCNVRQVSTNNSKSHEANPYLSHNMTVC